MWILLLCCHSQAALPCCCFTTQEELNPFLYGKLKEGQQFANIKTPAETVTGKHLTAVCCIKMGDLNLLPLE